MNRIRSLFGLNILILIFISCAHLKEVKQAYSMEEYKKAFQLSEKTVLEDSTDIDAWLYLAKSSVALNYTEQGVEALKTINRLDPKSKKHRRDLSQLYQQLAEKALERNENQKSVQYYLMAESLEPGNMKLLIRTAEAAFEAGCLNTAKLRYEKLIDLSRDPSNYIQRLNIIESRIQFAQTEFVTGMEKYEAGRFGDAVKHLESATKTQTENQEAEFFFYLSKGKYLCQLGTGKAYLEAIVLFTRASQIKPQQAEPFYLTGRAYEMYNQRKSLGKAVLAYQKALEVEPKGEFATTCKKKIKKLRQRQEKLNKFWNRGKE